MPKVDDESFHSGAENFPDDVPDENGATHIAMFLTWAIDRGLLADPKVPTETVEAIRKREMSGRDFLLEHYYGQLHSERFNEEGKDFAETQYEDFLRDYHHLLCPGLPSEYHVEYNEANYRIMAAALDERWARRQQEKRERL